jgi:hypothetical protein
VRACPSSVKARRFFAAPGLVTSRRLQLVRELTGAIRLSRSRELGSQEKKILQIEMLECWNVLLLRSCLGAARRALHCSCRGPSRAGASARRGVTAPTRMHGSAKPMRELQNLLPRADHTEVYA